MSDREFTVRIINWLFRKGLLHELPSALRQKARQVMRQEQERFFMNVNSEVE